MGSPAPEGSPVERPTKRAKVDDFAAVSTSGTETASAGPDGGARVIHGDGAPTVLEGVTDKPATQSGDAVMADAPQADGNHSSSGVKSEVNRNGGAGEVAAPKVDARDTRSGMAPVKAEYLISRSELLNQDEAAVDDDAAEARGQHDEQQDRRDARDSRDRKGKKSGGQNKERTFGKSDDALKLCNSRAYYSEFSPRECKFGERCKLCHDLRKYLQEGRREDVEAFEGKCPVFEVYGRCPSGWKCRFVKGHMKEVEREDGRKELVLLGARDQQPGAEEGGAGAAPDPEDERPSVVNVVDQSVKIDLNRRRVDMAEADKYITWLNDETKLNKEVHHRRKNQNTDDNKDVQAQYVEPPFLPSEKRKLYFGRETPALAPLTTQGNLPFRRLCVELGAQLTYSEMALGLPLIQGNKSDWALMRAHGSEITPPAFSPAAESPNIVQDYENSRDIKFGVQISANQPWVAVKATEALKRFCPHLRLIDVNCGCPIDSVYKSGAGSALLEAHGKLERIIRGMNAVSGEIPITAKIRMGVKTNKPNATSTIGKLAFGSRETRDRLGAPGCAAITLHGRSREQRYSRRADWSYIAECSALIKSYNERKDELTDTAGEPEERTLPNSKDGRMYFLGNGDCYSHEEYFEHIDKAGVDTVMIGRGALVKPWLYEEIEKGQYIDKSASERLGYIEKFVKYGLEAWGSDELGIGFTRRFLLEWMSFTHRYVPIGLLERLPPSLNDRPPAYRGRNDLETLLASNNYKDWIKISEMFLGPCHPGFTFQPKHKSNAYEAEG